MAQTITVKFCSPEELQKYAQSDPRYSEVDDSNLGFADRERGKIFILNTHSFELNKYLLDHELEHLFEAEGTHEDQHGIRHKKFFKETLRNLGSVAAAPFTGGLSLAAGTKDFRNKVGDIIPNEVGRFIPTLAGVDQGQPLGRSIQTTFKKGVPMAATLAAGALLPGVGSAIMNPLMAGFGQAGAGAAAGAGSVISKLAGGVKTAFGAAGSALKSPLSLFKAGSAAAGGAAAGAGTASSGFKLGSILGPALLGGGIAALGQKLGPKRPEMPNLSETPSIQQFGQAVNTKLQPLSDRLKNLSNTPLPSEMEAPIRRQYQQLKKRMTSHFLGARPGADLATDSEYRQAIQGLEQQEAEAVSQAQFNFQGNERENIKAQLGVDEQQLNAMGQIAQLDVQSIMAETGLQAEEAAQFKQIFGQIGAAVAGAGIMNAFRP